MDNNYLVICKNQKEAARLLQWFRNYIYEHIDPTMRAFKIAHCVAFHVDNVGYYLRFVSEAKAFEASRGFHGKIINQTAIENFLEEKGEEK